jgi:transcription elongation factor Elf1
MKYKVLEVYFTCDSCGKKHITSCTLAPDSEWPAVTTPKDWCTVTMNDVTKDYCPECTSSRIANIGGNK